HGYTGVRHWWMVGSVAAKVARFAQVPVLVLREGGSVPEERHAGERPLRVLVPLDGSDYARAALVPAAYLAAALAVPGQGALHLTHIVQPAHEARVPTRTARATARTAQDTQTALNMAREYLAATVQQIRDRSRVSGIADLNLELTSSVTTDDDIAQGIIRVAENGGGESAARLAQQLEWQLVDHQIVAEAARELETHESVVQAHDEHVAGVLSRLFGWPFPTTSQDTQAYHEKLLHLVESAANAGHV